MLHFGGSSRALSGTRLVTETGHSSREVTAPCRVFSLETLAPALLRRSPRALGLHRLGFRVFALQAPGKHASDPRVPLMGFGSSSEAAQAPSRCPEPSVSRKPDARFEPDTIKQRLP